MSEGWKTIFIICLPQNPANLQPANLQPATLIYSELLL